MADVEKEENQHWDPGIRVWRGNEHQHPEHQGRKGLGMEWHEPLAARRRRACSKTKDLCASLESIKKFTRDSLSSSPLTKHPEGMVQAVYRYIRETITGG